MAMLHGRNGKVNWKGSDVENITEWSFDADCDMAETSVMSDSNYWRTYLPGFKNWTATVEVNVDTSDLYPGLQSDVAGDLGDFSDATFATCQLQLWFSHTVTDGVLIGNAIFNGMSVTNTANDIAKISYGFQGTGEAHWSDAVT